MTEQESWHERRQRIIRCKTHGLHYDPKLASGCTLCLKESAKSQPQRAPQFTIILLCVLGMSVVLFQIFGPQETLEAGLEGLPLSEASGSPKLAPEPYRALIQAFERDLFRKVTDDPALAAARADLAAAAHNLGEAIRERERGTETGRAGAEAVAELGPPDEGAFDFRALEETRADWLRIRQRLFEPAPWFADPDRRGSRQERLAAVEFSALASRVEALIEEVAAEAQAFADTAGPGGDRDARLEEFHGDWRQRLADVWNDQPRRPEPETDPRVLMAVQQVEQAFKGAWALSAEPGFLRSRDAVFRLDEIRQQIREAQDAFAAAGG